MRGQVLMLQGQCQGARQRGQRQQAAVGTHQGGQLPDGGAAHADELVPDAGPLPLQRSSRPHNAADLDLPIYPRGDDLQ